MQIKEDMPLKQIEWMGDTLKVLRGFPDKVQNSIGHSLMVVQGGFTPSDAKHFKGVGSGIFEIVTRSDGEAYRTVYAVKIAEHVYVLHIFQKKSKTGIKTPQKDVDLIVSRYKEALHKEGKQ
jgi:phage-related protein